MALTISDELEWMSCCACGVAFAAPVGLWKARRESKDAFYCPNGHRQTFTETTADRLQRELTRCQQERDAARVARDAAALRADRNWRALKRAKKALGK